MDDEAEVYKLWRVRKTVMQLCHDRGYLVTQAELDQTLENFKEMFGDKPSERRPARSDLILLVAHNDDPTDQMFVFFPDDVKIGIKVIKTYCQRMQEENITRAIIVVQQGMTPSAKQSLIDMAPKYILEQFLESELLINITEHELVPEHYVLTADEKSELLTRYKLKENQLMRIQAGDPVARYFGLRRGQVVKIAYGVTDSSAGFFLSAGLFVAHPMLPRIAVVTGANRGIGLKTVEALSRIKGDGWLVYLTSRNEESGQRALENLRLKNCRFYRLDVTDSQSIFDFADHLRKEYGGVDILVNNAGMAFSPKSTLSLAQRAQQAVATNYFGTMNVTAALFPLLRPHSRVVNMSSSAGHLQRIPSMELKQKLASDSLTVKELSSLMQEFVDACQNPESVRDVWGEFPYVVSKVGVAALSRIQQRVFDKDPRPDMIVNHVHPGYVDTQLFRLYHEGTDISARRPRPPEEGCKSCVFAATIPENAGSPKGEFIWSDCSLVDWVKGPLPTQPKPKES
ncbi:unnamed protein product [Cyprideis torosa]|uniref:DNA-directed RNA polymerases I, II, and III subunit RPABC1 n=1 Tax=Cyprideis torosa TaxID=163714 RepID=A0A7R8ZG33_9CRUS|nr:unnamed protein product [Cyprideis torosa]CAG0880640.1 unnamed protein product [Cyprideis torosa]